MGAKSRRRKAELKIAVELGIKRTDIPKLRDEGWFEMLVDRESRLDEIAEESEGFEGDGGPEEIDDAIQALDRIHTIAQGKETP